MIDSSKERRRFHRIGFDAPTIIKQGSDTWVTQSQDISLKGLLVHKPDGWSSRSSDDYEARVDLGGDTEVVLQLTLRHADDRSLGFVCHHIDLESVSHLRRLVELNLGDEALLERELAALNTD
jgi:hypothetical protein